MAKWIQAPRVRAAIEALAQWRGRAKSQAAMHLWPLLALLEKGCNTSDFVCFTHSDESDFWDRYGRLPGEQRGRSDANGHSQGYYVDPLVESMKPADYPHRGPWSIRIRTFLNSWRVAERPSDDETKWRLSGTFADVFVSKALQRNDVIHRVPVVDLAVWLFREREFPDNATDKSLEKLFQETFRLTETDYDKIFEFVAESPGAIFAGTRPSDEEYLAAIEQALVRQDAEIPEPAALYGDDSSKRSLLEENDLVLQQVQKLIALGTSGIIFHGCPGTSKTWYAKQIARQLVADVAHIYQTQFHPSFGYEDFVEGYRPDESSKSGFKVVDKVFLEACEIAKRVSTPVVFIIDEINRGDPARVFGELLTYIEYGYRNEPFRRAYSGNEASVPTNLLILGTMNQTDRSITQLDLALFRRFDHVDLEPSSEAVQKFLEASGGFTPDQIDRVVKWFESLQRILPIGHTYFKDARTPEQIHMIWQYRMKPYCTAVLELEPEKLEVVGKTFEVMYKGLIGRIETGAEG